MANATQCYYGGDYYDCIVSTDSIGQSPLTDPTKWSKIQIPRDWRAVMAGLTYAHLLELDGQTDKASIEFNRARARLEDLVREAANQESWRVRPAVEVRT